jgi:hypothetical protein
MDAAASSAHASTRDRGDENAPSPRASKIIIDNPHNPKRLSIKFFCAPFKNLGPDNGVDQSEHRWMTVLDFRLIGRKLSIKEAP